MCRRGIARSSREEPQVNATCCLSSPKDGLREANLDGCPSNMQTRGVPGHTPYPIHLRHVLELFLDCSQRDPGDRMGFPAVNVQTRGWTWIGKIMFLISVLFFPVYVLAFNYLTIGGFVGGLPGSMIAAAAASTTTYLLGLSSASVRSIEVSPAGVAFHYLFNTERGDWADLRPSSFPPNRGCWFIMRRRPSSQFLPVRGHRLTLEQSRAILTYPTCPRWVLPDGVERWIGLDQGSFSSRESIQGIVDLR